MFFIFCTTDGWWGNSEALRAAERGKSVDFVRLLYIIRLYLSLLFRRQAGIEYNYLLCIIALSCCFSGASAARWWRLECKRLFCLLGGLAYWFFWGTRKSNVPNVGWLQKVWQKKTTVGWIARRQAKRLCKPCTSACSASWRERVRIFACRWLPCGAVRNLLSGETCPLILIALYWHTLQKCTSGCKFAICYSRIESFIFSFVSVYWFLHSSFHFLVILTISIT